MKLISNTAFGDLLRTKNIPDYEYRYLRDKFDEFLKQILEIWMFTPCKLVDGVWVVLTRPDFNDDLQISDINFFNERKKEYQQAKERCLFEGFEYKGETEFSWIFKHGKTYPIMIFKRDVECLVIVLKREIELTPTAIKQLS